MPNPVTAVTAGTSVLGGAISSRGASKAASAQERAAQADLALKREMFEKEIALQEPFRELSLQQLNQLAALYGPGGEFTRTPTMEDLVRDPGYQFRLSEGEKALARMQSARGGGIGLASGRAIREGVRYGSELASQEFGAASAREANRRAAITNALLGIGGYGPAATSAMGGAARTFGAGGGSALSDVGASRASGYIGQANALNEALSGLAGAYGRSQSGLSRESLQSILPDYVVQSRKR